MPSMAYVVEEALADILAAVQTIVGARELPAIEPANPRFGADFAMPCFAPAKVARKSPQEIAGLIASGLKHPAIARVEALAGFVNIWLSQATVGRALGQVLEQGHAFGAHQHSKQRVVIEVNNQNPFKDVHIGHAYNSIVGDTLANVLELEGAKVHRVSYRGDVGVHVGKSMWAILRFTDGDVKKLETIPRAERAAFLSRMYVEGAGEYDDNPLVRQQIDELARQSFALSDPLFKEVYGITKQWSLDYIHTILKRLNCQTSEREFMESETDRLGREAVEAHIGDVFERSDGAVIFRGEPHGLHTRVFISSHNTTLYEARDLGLIKLKQREFHPDKSFIVTAEEQRDYFNVVLKAAGLAMPELAGTTVNIPHGTVKLSTGKMSSRTGKVVNIEWLFTTIEQAARELGATDTTVAATVVGALRYAMLKVRIGSDIIFDIQESVSLEGNSGPYIQYAYARGRSILGKLGEVPATETLREMTHEEHALAVKILAYPDATKKAITELAPHHICTYLHELTQRFNSFYEHNRIVGDPRETTRAVLVQAYCQALKNGLELLNIPAPARM